MTNYFLLLLTVNTHDNTFTLNPEFYVIKHFSHFVKEGSIRLRTKGYLTGNSIVFKNPNGEIIIVIQNGLNEKKNLAFPMKIKNSTYPYHQIPLIPLLYKDNSPT